MRSTCTVLWSDHAHDTLMIYDKLSVHVYGAAFCQSYGVCVTVDDVLQLEVVNVHMDALKQELQAALAADQESTEKLSMTTDMEQPCATPHPRRITAELPDTTTSTGKTPTSVQLRHADLASRLQHMQHRVAMLLDIAGNMHLATPRDRSVPSSSRGQVRGPWLEGCVTEDGRPSITGTVAKAQRQLLFQDQSDCTGPLTEAVKATTAAVAVSIPVLDGFDCVLPTPPVNSPLAHEVRK